VTRSNVDSDALEHCRVAVSSQAAQFGALGDAFHGGGTSHSGGTDQSIFGKLPSASALSGAVEGFNRTVDGELHAAESVLRKVERALDAVHRTVGDVEHANARGLTAS
jgi:hypothetical protein